MACAIGLTVKYCGLLLSLFCVSLPIAMHKMVLPCNSVAPLTQALSFTTASLSDKDDNEEGQHPAGWRHRLEHDPLLLAILTVCFERER